MANQYPNEKEVFDKIKQDQLLIAAPTWDVLFDRIGDDISAINLIVGYYVDKNEDIPLEDAKKILTFTKRTTDAFRNIIYREVSVPFKELFGHYVGNDINSINMIVGCCLDPLDEQPIPVNDGKRILEHTAGVVKFIYRLKATG